MKVQLGQYKPYENTFDDSVQKSTIPDFLPELDEVLRLLSTAKCCPYYSLLYRMSSSHLIVTTYGALKETLNGSRPVGERLPLDESTFLLCDDMFALERTFDCCYDFTLSTFDLRHAITFGHERAVFVRQTYDVVFAENKPERNEAENALRDIVQFLERLYWILEEGSSPDLGKILGILGLSHLSPTSSHRIITSFIADATLPSFQSKLRPSVLKAWLQIQQLFLNLMNLDVVRWTLSKDKDVPFRFWFDNDTFANQKPNLKTYKFFGVSSSPALQALKSMRVPCLVTIGVMVPVSFSVLPADILTIYPATLLEKQNAIQTANLHSALLYAGPDKVRLSFIAAAKNDSRNILTIGQVLLNILEVLPGNVLVLFPSASFYETCLLTWSMHRKLCTLNEFFTFIKCCSPGCVECNQEVSLQEQEGKIVVSTVRCALPDAIAGGFHAVVNVSLAYTNFKSGFNVAKEAHLKNHSKRAAWNFYTQEAINAMVSPLIKSSCLDPMAALRGRILINLDDRLIKLQDEIPLFLLKRTVATDLFDDGMNRLKSFLNNVPGWDLTTISGPGILERAKLHLLRISDSCWFKEDLHSAIVKRVSELLEQFDTDGNIDLLAAGILDAIQIKDLLLRSDLHSVVLSWVFSFRGFFQSDAHQEYWPLVISGLLKQYGENMAKETESDMAVPRPTCPLV
ncbi:hypothetical protein RvY_01248 [Ramazzottius varieornatus]|uniref:Uncharacterized protein n=1 Tax=Ramazzottius varieornatus TaxID=947166 RepID=A0A1D1UMS5_RAMVA|nr:hypothetical protein RvY_01248 [Ramazzottius varieornatus]